MWQRITTLLLLSSAVLSNGVSTFVDNRHVRVIGDRGAAILQPPHPVQLAVESKKDQEGGSGAHVEDSPAIIEMKNRPLCASRLEQIRVRNNGRDTLYMKTMREIITRLSQQITDGDTDKHISRVSDKLISAKPNHLSLFVTCAVDELGHTILMKLVLSNLPDSLRRPLYWTDWKQNTYSIDKEGNNLIHLAVLSGSKEILEMVLEHISASMPSMHSTVALLQSKNFAGQTALALAAENSRVEILETLKEAYTNAEIITTVEALAGATTAFEQPDRISAPRQLAPARLHK